MTKPNKEDFTDEYPEVGDTITSTNCEEYVCVHAERDDEFYEIVLHHEITDTFWSMTGDYDSWDGISFDYAEIVQVRPQEKITTVYVNV